MIRRLLVSAVLAAVAFPAGVAHAQDNPPPVAGPVHILEADVPAWCADGTLTVAREPDATFYVCVRPQSHVDVPAPSAVVVSPDGHVLTRGTVAARLGYIPAWVTLALGG